MAELVAVAHHGRGDRRRHAASESSAHSDRILLARFGALLEQWPDLCASAAELARDDRPPGVPLT
ncbi:hypothetical protein [Nannocystis pusilla]|uniref:hypothetical protein n=1 Tax=Nannocystis pusilla TaxID=889268 RepID=UPI003BF1C824